MITDVTCSNGVVLKYDASIVPGDIITAYHKGYWKVTKVTPRKCCTPIIEYTKVGGKGSKSCDGAYCTKIDIEQHFDEMVAEAYKIRDMLLTAKGN